ncbi:hypothetical protein [Thermoflavimicrobium daqui]|uniref:Uncharacterized protein n=1 Tax=Thermoflavimicrobium daqui TaxID=2137476 RepID=A0A364K6W8_9BACL|nr:hypothetical protein [Thermoflavimicrobium daqui]RAL25940.1 hypothetical protein DL897_07670 [Thermoflavimicrobium daqui]
MKLYVKGEPQEVETFLDNVKSQKYDVITHFKEKDCFYSDNLRVGATIEMSEKSRQSLLVKITTSDGNKIELDLLDGKVIEMDQTKLIIGKVYDIFG